MSTNRRDFLKGIIAAGASAPFVKPKAAPLPVSRIKLDGPNRVITLPHEMDGIEVYRQIMEWADEFQNLSYPNPMLPITVKHFELLNGWDLQPRGYFNATLTERDPVPYFNVRESYRVTLDDDTMTLEIPVYNQKAVDGLRHAFIKNTPVEFGGAIHGMPQNKHWRIIKLQHTAEPYLHDVIELVAVLWKD